MNTRKLGYSDLHITTIGLGTWAIGGPGWKFSWGKQDDDDSINTIHRALDLGINWIDTAAIYGLGHSEEILVLQRKVYRKPFQTVLAMGKISRVISALIITNHSNGKSRIEFWHRQHTHQK